MLVRTQVSLIHGAHLTKYRKLCFSSKFLIRLQIAMLVLCCYLTGVHRCKILKITLLLALILKPIFQQNANPFTLGFRVGGCIQRDTPTQSKLNFCYHNSLSRLEIALLVFCCFLTVLHRHKSLKNYAIS